MKFNTNTTLWKRLSGTALALVLGAGVAAAQVNVTIEVDMATEVGTFTTVHCPGSWNGFDPTTALMSNVGGDVYSITFSVPAGVEQIYKIVKDMSYANEETVPAACGKPNGFGTFDRAITPTADETVEFCWSSCVSCSATTSVDITFQVNMVNVIDDPLGAHIAGDFNGFTPTAMTNIGGGLYEITYSLVAGNTFRYKFLNGDNFSVEEQVDSVCGIPNGFGGYDREFTVPGVNSTIGPVCFGECSNCSASCSIASPPQDPRTTQTAPKVQLIWNGIPNSVACQIKAKRLVPPGPAPQQNVIGFERQTTDVPKTLLGLGTTWEWQVRCACQTSPSVLATALSEKDTFAVPALRIADLSDINMTVFPNPAVSEITITVDAAQSGMADYTVVDLLGRNLINGQFDVQAGRNTLPVSVSSLENGVYFIRMEQNGSETVNQFTVTR